MDNAGMSPRRPVKPLTFKPMVPDVPPVAQVMARRQSAIQSLMYRLRLSEACLETVQRVVPAAMASQAPSRADSMPTGNQLRVGLGRARGWWKLVSRRGMGHRWHR